MRTTPASSPGSTAAYRERRSGSERGGGEPNPWIAQGNEYSTLATCERRHSSFVSRSHLAGPHMPQGADSRVAAASGWSTGCAQWETHVAADRRRVAFVSRHRFDSPPSLRTERFCRMLQKACTPQRNTARRPDLRARWPANLRLMGRYWVKTLGAQFPSALSETLANPQHHASIQTHDCQLSPFDAQM